MGLRITPETEARLDELALKMRRDKNDLVQEAVNNLLSYNEWLEQKVNASITAAEGGQVVANDEVHRWIESRECS